jgi:tetratricopeptide (TPR) repeat protein
MAKTSNLLACAALAIALGASHSADANPKQEAKVHIDRASKAHKAGNLEKALVELQAAYSIDPQPQLLYAMGQIYTKLGRCSDASDAYLRFLATGTDEGTAQVVKQAMEACKGGPSTQEPQTAKTAPPPEEPAEATPKTPATPSSDTEEPPELKPDKKPPPKKPPPVAKASPAKKKPAHRRVAINRERDEAPPADSGAAKPWYRDVVGDVLVAGGVTSLVLGGLAYRAAVTDLDTAEMVNTNEKYLELVDGAHTKRLVGVALATGGAVLVTAGVLRFMLRDKHTEVRRVGLAPARGGGVLTWTRSF